MVAVHRRIKAYTIPGKPPAVPDAAVTGPDWTGLKGRVDPGTIAPYAGMVSAKGASAPEWVRYAVSADWYSNFTDTVTRARELGDGGRINLSPDTDYQLTEPIPGYSGLEFHGESQGTSRILAAAGESVIQAHDPTERIDYMKMIGVALVGNYTDTPYGLDARGMSQCHFDMLRILGFTEAGVYWGGNEADGYVAGWSNSFWRGWIVVNDGASGMLFDGVTGTGASTSNYMDIRRCNINLENLAGTIGLNMIRGDGNLVDHCDVGYGNASLPIFVGFNANYNEFAFNRVEGVVQGAIVEGSSNRFIANHLAGGAGVVHPVEVRYPGQFNEFLANSYSPSAPTPNVLEVLGGSGQSPLTTVLDAKSRIFRDTVNFETGSGGLAYETRQRGDAFRRFAQFGSGALAWYDQTTGTMTTRLRQTSVSSNVMEWDNETMVKIPIVATLPTANSARRGAMVRVVAGTGVRDGVHVCVKNVADGYEWVNLTP